MFLDWSIRKRGRWSAALIVLSVVLFLQHTPSQAQKPVLRFLSDSVSFGQPIQAVFYCKHAPEVELLFPDSNYRYFPFEFIKKTYFPTRTINGESSDSVIYTLRTFEDTSLYSLALPVLLFSEKDTIRLFSDQDSVYFKPYITELSDTLKLISNTQPLALDNDFNYIIYLIGIVAIAVLALLGYVLFGKRLIQQLKQYRMKMAHKQFIASFDALTRAQDLSVENIEKALSLWKKYIQELKDKPYTTYTSAEIATQLKRVELKKNLQSIDAAIYGGRTKEMASQDFSVLRNVAIEELTTALGDQSTKIGQIPDSQGDGPVSKVSTNGDKEK